MFFGWNGGHSDENLIHLLILEEWVEIGHFMYCFCRFSFAIESTVSVQDLL